MTGAKKAVAKKTAAAKPKTCNVPGCSQPVYHRGLCDEHWASRRDLADDA